MFRNYVPIYYDFRVSRNLGVFLGGLDIIHSKLRVIFRFLLKQPIHIFINRPNTQIDMLFLIKLRICYACVTENLYPSPPNTIISLSYSHDRLHNPANIGQRRDGYFVCYLSNISAVRWMKLEVPPCNLFCFTNHHI